MKVLIQLFAVLCVCTATAHGVRIPGAMPDYVAAAAHKQSLNYSVLNKEVRTQQATPTVPFGFKSTEGKIQVTVYVTNDRNDKVKYWWVDYGGNPVLSHLGTVPAHTTNSVLWTYGTHPWLITTESGELITAFIPHTANMHVTVEDEASWTQQVNTPTVPFGIESTEGKIKLRVFVTNNRGGFAKYWWINYDGNPVLSHLGKVPAHTVNSVLWTYGTHPWLITTECGELITTFVPYTANMRVTVEDEASWK